MESTCTTPKLWDLLAHIFLSKACAFSQYLPFINSSHDKKEKSCLSEMICSCIILDQVWLYVIEIPKQRWFKQNRSLFLSVVKAWKQASLGLIQPILRTTESVPLYFIAIQVPSLPHGPKRLLECQQLHMNSSLQKE